MKLWTFQSEDSWQALQSDGILRTGPFDEGYLFDNWMSEQLTKRVGPPPEGTAYPIWGWYRKRARRRPEPNEWGPCLYNYGDNFVRMEVNIPDSAVLLSSFDHWENITFGFLLASNKKEMKLLVDELNSAGFVYPCKYSGCAERHDTKDVCMPGGVAFLALCDHNHAAMEHPELGPMIRQRWEFIFDQEYISGKFASKKRYLTQAVFWELRLEQVVNVNHFGGKRAISIGPGTTQAQ